MSAVPKPKKLTAAEYLEIERKAEFKSEFFDGMMYPVYRDGPVAMAGAAPAHNKVKENLIVELGGQFKGKGCRTFSSDQRVRTSPNGLYAYPDIAVVCGPEEYAADDPNTLLNPVVLIEVLSDGTERYDRRLKFEQYKQIPSFREYVLVAQDAAEVERFVRQADGLWGHTSFVGLDAELALTAVPARIRLADIYADVTLPDPPPGRP